MRKSISTVQYEKTHTLESLPQAGRRKGQMIQRGADRWLLRVAVGREENGKRLYSSKTIVGSKEDAGLVLDDAIARAERGDPAPFGFMARMADAGPPMELKNGAIAAANELIVVVDLLRRGYDVYRSVGASGACDMVALKYGSSLCCRIEVKTAHRRGGRLCFTVREEQLPCHDVLALVVLLDGSITYAPTLEEWELKTGFSSTCTRNAHISSVPAS